MKIKSVVADGGEFYPKRGWGTMKASVEKVIRHAKFAIIIKI
jgi:hypothetical protein